MIIKDFIPIGKVIKLDYVDKNGKKQTTTITRRSGNKIKTKKICIHNNANPNSTAQNERDWLMNPINQRSASWHECIDENMSVIAIPWGEQAFHSSTVLGNNESYGIEICEKNFKLVYPKAVIRVAYLLNENGLTINDLTTHNAYSGKDCPRLMLPMWDTFVKDVKAELDKLNNPIVDKDALDTSTWAIEARLWAINSGITDGARPKDAMKREELWATLYNYHKKFNGGDK
jgi:N-acetylmuramoyl-L-alanine amidase